MYMGDIKIFAKTNKKKKKKKEKKKKKRKKPWFKQ